jgi:hypothetical protein
LKRYVGSNLDRGFQIGRLGLVGRAGGGGNTPATLFRGGTARGSPDFTVNGVLGVKLGKAWVWRDQRVMRDLPEAKAGLGEARGRDCDGGGGSARRSSPACGVPASGTGQSLQHLAQKDQGDVLMLTEGLD